MASKSRHAPHIPIPPRLAADIQDRFWPIDVGKILQRYSKKLLQRDNHHIPGIEMDLCPLRSTTVSELFRTFLCRTSKQSGRDAEAFRYQTGLPQLPANPSKTHPVKGRPFPISLRYPSLPQTRMHAFDRDFAACHCYRNLRSQNQNYARPQER